MLFFHTIKIKSAGYTREKDVREDMLTTLDEFRRELKRTFEICMNCISFPRSNKGRVQPNGISECRSSLDVYRETCFGTGCIEVGPPEDIASVEPVVSSEENHRGCWLERIDGGSVICERPKSVRVRGNDFRQAIGGSLLNIQES